VFVVRQDAAGIIKRLKSSKKPVFITQQGRVSAVLVRAEDYERTQHEIGILRALVQGELEIDLGERADLDTVFAKADELLSSDE
jgi:prevent-host-death family protein